MKIKLEVSDKQLQLIDEIATRTGKDKETITWLMCNHLEDTITDYLRTELSLMKKD